MNLKKEKRKLYFVTTVVMLTVIFLPNRYISLILALVYLLGTSLYLYNHNFFLEDSENEDGTKSRAFKEPLILIVVITLLAVVGVILSERNMFTESMECMYANAMFIIIIVWFGRIAGKIPMNGFIGLRLPWMLQDEETWNVGHRLCGYCSLPLAIIYLALIPFIDTHILACSAAALYIAIPGIGSYIFYKKKYRT